MTRARAALAGALVTLVVVGPLALIAHGRAVDRARQDTLDRAGANLDAALTSGWAQDAPVPANTWDVNLADGWTNPYGEVTTDPPLLALAEPVPDGDTVREYDFDGGWLARGLATPNGTVVLTVVERDSQDRAIARSRFLWVAVALGLAGAVAGAAWSVWGRIQAPVARAHDVNRDFIADAAHELRTPLAIIQASAGQALARDREVEAYRESLTEILQAAERASGGVGALLEFARLEAGQATPRLAPLRLDLLTEEVAAAVRVDGATIEAEPGDAVVVAADYNLVRQMLVNLTENAAARATKVSLSTRLERHGAVVEILDDGPGFDPGIIDHVFERFRRGDRSGSVGLGMAVARTIAELHGGSTEATNRPDGGALVTVHLPHGPIGG